MTTDERKQQIFEQISDYLVKEMDIRVEDISMEMTLKEDLVTDSLQIYEFVVDLEEGYGIELPDELLDDVVTLENIIDIVCKLTAEEE